ncbi:hypothetical protein [Actinotalea sp. Marseille-Q4924]|uniref:hypothetical protein n=1 Tax=Actinotalea sp. Marseille-Q4924 TaxID=2866571 RepID=UPI001CE4308C|nr:hypothetical protein [Actinotalea sp. Marseille-Q4924]
MSLRRTTTALAAAGLLATVAALPAQASAPERTVETLEFTLAEHPYFSEVCGFPVSVHVWGEFLVRTWTDEEGAAVRELRHFKFRSESSANGKTVRGVTMGPETAVFHPDGSATVHIRGIVTRVVSGEGTVKLAWGSGLTLWPADGSEDVVLEPTGGPEDLQPFCDYLAP